MSREYAEIKIKEALKMHDGNLARARQQVVAWTYDDAKLLHALARPHLNGIVAYQVERVASGRAELERRVPIASQPAKGENFGMDLLRAVAASSTAVFGQESYAAPVRKGAASKQHMDAIRHIASKASVPPKKPMRKE